MKRWMMLTAAAAALMILFSGCASAPTEIMEEAPFSAASAVVGETPEDKPEGAEEKPEPKETPTDVSMPEKVSTTEETEESPPPQQQGEMPAKGPVEKAVSLKTSPPKEPAPAAPPPEAAPSKPEPEIHTHSYRETVIAPTCEAGGYTKHVCSCGDSFTDGATAALGHVYAQTGHADATTAAAGYTEYTCSRCGMSYRDTIPQIIVTGASDADAQRVCDNVNSYISSHYAITQNRGTYMGVTWVTSPSDVQGAINSAIGTVDLYAQYYGAKSFCCGYFDDGGGNYTIVLYWDTI